MDKGPIIMQAVVPVLVDDTPLLLRRRIFKVEKCCYTKVLRWIAEGRVKVIDERVIVRSPIL
jgi:phosphoribosylglycinamide formyltransferase-1